MTPKFKLWDKKNKRMITWLEQDANYCIALNGEIHAISYGDTPFNVTLPEHLEIIQSTGLKDKNGVEIFEGDIIKYGNSKGVHIKQVKYNEQRACFAALSKWEMVKHLQENTIVLFMMPSRDFCMRKVEIIGNIHDNTELLERESE